MQECKEGQPDITETREALRKLKILIPNIKFLPNDNLLTEFLRYKFSCIIYISLRRDTTIFYEIAEKCEAKMVPGKRNNNCHITGVFGLALDLFCLWNKSPRNWYVSDQGQKIWSLFQVNQTDVYSIRKEEGFLKEQHDWNQSSTISKAKT